MKIASVTGASGVIGSHLIRLLSDNGIQVRALSRKERPSEKAVDYVYGELGDDDSLKQLLKGAHYLFHCAGERHNLDRMRDVNVEGTNRLFRIASETTIEYFCHLSSAGVVGQTRSKIIDESCECRPQNLYEQTKREAEQVVLKGIDDCRVVILRPTNVVSDDEHGILTPIFHPSVKNRLKLLITGGERSHMVHAENVAAAAIHLMGVVAETPEVYFVSLDHEPNTRLHEIASLHRLNRHPNASRTSKRWHLPISAPYHLRRILRGGGNKGNLVYSSRKLISTDFHYPVGVTETIHRISSALTDPQ